MGNKKCVITRYDKTITKPPYLTIPLDECIVEKPEIDNLGEEFARRLSFACRLKGYEMKFYTQSSETDFDYEIVVY